MYPGILANQIHVLNWFPEAIFIFPTVASAYKIKVTGEINMSWEGKGLRSDDKESFKELKGKL